MGDSHEVKKPAHEVILQAIQDQIDAHPYAKDIDATIEPSKSNFALLCRLLGSIKLPASEQDKVIKKLELMRQIAELEAQVSSFYARDLTMVMASIIPND
ncbi:MAG: hypothetical protein AAB594_02365 [Patescibacteria group bacterium]